MSTIITANRACRCWREQCCTWCCERRGTISQQLFIAVDERALPGLPKKNAPPSLVLNNLSFQFQFVNQWILHPSWTTIFANITRTAIIARERETTLGHKVEADSRPWEFYHSEYHRRRRNQAKSGIAKSKIHQALAFTFAFVSPPRAFLLFKRSSRREDLHTNTDQFFYGCVSLSKAPLYQWDQAYQWVLSDQSYKHCISSLIAQQSTYSLFGIDNVAPLNFLLTDSPVCNQTRFVNETQLDTTKPFSPRLTPLFQEPLLSYPRACNYTIIGYSAQEPPASWQTPT